MHGGERSVAETNRSNHLNRRTFVKLAGITAAGAIVGVSTAEGKPSKPKAISLFDGKTLKGWAQIENSATSLGGSGISDPAALAAKLTNGTDAVSVFLRGQLPDSLKA